MDLKALMEKLAKQQADLGKVFDEAGDGLDFSKVKIIAGTDTEKAAKVREMNDDCAKTMKEINDARATLKAKEDYAERQKVSDVVHPAVKEAKDFAEAKAMSFGEAFFKCGINKKENRHKEFMLDEGVNLKTVMSTAAGWAPQSIRTGKVVDIATRPIQVIDLIPANTTNMAAVVYMEETTFTNNAAEVSEAGPFGEGALALTERTSTVRKIAVFLPVTDEQMEDIPQVSGYLNNRLPFMIRQRLDSQIINGDGNAPNLKGILNVSGVQAYARKTNPTDQPVDALRRAITLVRIVGRALPNMVIMNPYDWESIRLMKTQQGVYIWGHPAEMGPEQVWGLPVAQADSLAQYTAIVGDSTFSELAEKRGITVKVTDSHSDYFINGKQAVRADMRTAFLLYRPAAFVAVDLT